MNKEQQIEEIRHILENYIDYMKDECDKCVAACSRYNGTCMAYALYNAGYRKVSESEAELQELNIKYYNEAKNLRRDLADFDEFARQISKTRIELMGEAVPTCKTLLKYIETEKSKTVKEFAEKVKAKCSDYLYHTNFDGKNDFDIHISEISRMIDELLKEYEK